MGNGLIKPALALFGAILWTLSAGLTPSLALDPEEYDAAVRRFSVWLAQTTDSSTFHPASPVGIMPFQIFEGHPLPEFYGVSASYGYSQYNPSGGVRDTLSELTRGATIPGQFRSNKLTFSLGLSRRSSIGMHLIQYPALSTNGGGLHFEKLLFGVKPVFLSLRNTASRATGSGWFEYTGLFTEAIFGLHWTGLDLFAGLGTRVSRVRLKIDGESATGDHWILPFQRESWETHLGAEVFLTPKIALGGGVHFHQEGAGFGVRLIFKSRGTSTLLDPYLGRRRE